MNDPLVSVIIPAYKQAEYLGAAIRSVLEQTYTNLEAIVVDDASPDHTAAVVQAFADPRLRYIVHDRNRMLSAARNTGMRAAKGEIFALLDADDYFDRQKVALHVDFLRSHPDVGVTYNHRWELLCGSDSIRNFSSAPETVGLADLVLGFPFAPSDMVLRREWAFAVGLFDESFIHFSEDLDINCRLALAGCRFAGVPRALNFRRYHAGRVIRNAQQRGEAAMRSLDQTFADPRTPAAVHANKDYVYATHQIVWGVECMRQNDTANGLGWLCRAQRHWPALLAGWPNDVTTFLVYDCIYDETADHPRLYHNYIAQLAAAPEFAPVVQQAQWGIARGWLVKAYRELIWGSWSNGRTCLQEAARLGAVVDEPYINEVVHQLLGCELEFGYAAAATAARRMDKELRGALPSARQYSLAAALELGKAYERFRSGSYEAVPAHILRAMRTGHPQSFGRGSFSMLLRSTMRTWKEKLAL